MGFIKQNWLVFFVLSFTFSSFSQQIDLKADDLDLKKILESIFISPDSVKEQEDKSKIAFSLIPAPDMKSSEGGLVVSFVTTLVDSRP